jgi:hypothetical protein
LGGRQKRRKVRWEAPSGGGVERRPHICGDCCGATLDLQLTEGGTRQRRWSATRAAQRAAEDGRPLPRRRIWRFGLPFAQHPALRRSTPRETGSLWREVRRLSQENPQRLADERGTSRETRGISRGVCSRSRRGATYRSKTAASRGSSAGHWEGCTVKTSAEAPRLAREALHVGRDARLASGPRRQEVAQQITSRPGTSRDLGGTLVSDAQNLNSRQCRTVREKSGHLSR